MNLVNSIPAWNAEIITLRTIIDMSRPAHWATISPLPPKQPCGELSQAKDIVTKDRLHEHACPKVDDREDIHPQLSTVIEPKKKPNPNHEPQMNVFASGGFDEIGIKLLRGNAVNGFKFLMRDVIGRLAPQKAIIIRTQKTRNEGIAYQKAIKCPPKQCSSIIVWVGRIKFIENIRGNDTYHQRAENSPPADALLEVIKNPFRLFGLGGVWKGLAHYLSQSVIFLSASIITALLHPSHDYLLFRRQYFTSFNPSLLQRFSS